MSMRSVKLDWLMLPQIQPHFHPVDAENMHFTFGTKTPAEQPDTEIVGRVDTGHHRYRL